MSIGIAVNVNKNIINVKTSLLLVAGIIIGTNVLRIRQLEKEVEKLQADMSLR